jgi:two-component system cell cycle response regulator
VLVVEDDESIRRLLCAVLGARGYEVIEVGDGPSALPAARESRPDVVLLDVGLPGLDGFGVLELLKDDEELAAVPVLMVTAWAESDLIAKALDRGAHDYVRKPFDVDELGARVDVAARVKARQDALAEDNQRLTQIATIDALTSLANRFHITEELERELAGAARSRRPLSPIMLDLDHFKAVNDTHGHEAGDALLRAVARRLQRRLRRTDLIARWGGEEFVVIAPDTDADGAVIVAEDLRAGLCERPIDAPEAALRITASLGVAQWDGETRDELLKRCDVALYAAKDAGRNAVRLAEPGPSRLGLVA